MVVRFFIERLSKWLFLFICSYFLGLMYCCKLNRFFSLTRFSIIIQWRLSLSLKNLYNKIVFLDLGPCQFFIF